MAMSGFICHDDYLKKMVKLTDEEVGRLFRALMVYHATGEETEITGRESIAFDFIREDIDRTERAYQTKCEKNRKNRLDAIENERQRTLTNVNVPSQKEKEKEKEKKKTRTRSVFTPPTVEEVAAYCKERNNGIDAQHFVDYYTQGNWVLKNGRKMADWRAAVRTWEGNGYHNKPAGKTVSAQNYSQRDYSGEQEDAMRRMVGRTGRPAEQTAYNFTQRAYDDADDKIIQRMLAMGEETKGVTA